MGQIPELCRFLYVRTAKVARWVDEPSAPSSAADAQFECRDRAGAPDPRDEAAPSRPGGTDAAVPHRPRGAPGQVGLARPQAADARAVVDWQADSGGTGGMDGGHAVATTRLCGLDSSSSALSAVVHGGRDA